MATEINSKAYAKLVSLVKKDGLNDDETRALYSERHYADESGIPMGQIGKALYMAEVDAFPKLKIKATPAAIANARDKQGIRWPRIAARTGESVSQVQKMYEGHTGKSAADSYTGRGRKFNGASAPASRASGKAAPKNGRRKAAGTSGRRAKATEKAKATGRGRGRKAAAPAGRGRNRTRADRAAASGDPR